MPPEKLLDLKITIPPELSRSVVEAAWLDGLRTGVFVTAIVALLLAAVVLWWRGK